MLDCKGNRNFRISVTKNCSIVKCVLFMYTEEDENEDTTEYKLCVCDAVVLSLALIVNR